MMDAFRLFLTWTPRSNNIATIPKLSVRQTDNTDRRVVRILATRRGEQLLKEGRNARIELLTELLRTLDDHELKVLDKASTALERLSRPHAAMETVDAWSSGRL